MGLLQSGTVIVRPRRATTLWTPEQISTSLALDSQAPNTVFDSVSGGSLPANAGLVKRWESFVGSNVAVEAVQGAFYNTSILDGNKPAVAFPPSSGRLAATAFNSSAARSLFFLASASNSGYLYACQATGDAPELRITGAGNVLGYWNSQYQINAVDLNFSGWHVCGIILSGTSYKAYVDGVEVASRTLANACPANSQTVDIGNYRLHSSQYNGYIASIIDCPVALTTDERQKLEGWMKSKAGSAVTLVFGHPYRTVPPYV